MMTEGQCLYKSINIVATNLRSTKLIDVLDDSFFMEYPQNMIKKRKIENLLLIILIGYIIVPRTFN